MVMVMATLVDPEAIRLDQVQVQVQQAPELLGLELEQVLQVLDQIQVQLQVQVQVTEEHSQVQPQEELVV